jgi:hypothetical protein
LAGDSNKNPETYKPSVVLLKGDETLDDFVEVHPFFN